MAELTLDSVSVPSFDSAAKSCQSDDPFVRIGCAEWPHTCRWRAFASGEAKESRRVG